MNRYIFKVNKAGVWNFIFSSLLTAFIVYASNVMREVFLLQFIVIIIGLKIGLYSNIDYLHSKQLIKTDKGKLLLKCFGLTFNLTSDSSFLIIDKDMISLRNYSKHSYCLYIVRNNKVWMSRIFKNRIKLITDSSMYDIDKIMVDVANDFGLRYIDMREL